MPRGTANEGAAAFCALVTGRVQGVGFRYCAELEARRLSLRGWVRNLPDGEVELWAEGERRALAEFRAWLEEGPPGAYVDSVLASSRDPIGYESFTVEF